MFRKKGTRSKQLADVIEDRHRRPGYEDPENVDVPQLDEVPDDFSQSTPASGIAKQRKSALPLKAELRLELSEGKYAARSRYDNGDDGRASDDIDPVDPDAPFDEAEGEARIDDLFSMLDGSRTKRKKKDAKTAKRGRKGSLDDEDVVEEVPQMGHGLSGDLAHQVARLTELQKQSMTIREEVPAGSCGGTQEDTARWNTMALLRVRYQPCLVTATRLPISRDSFVATQQQTKLKRFAARLLPTDTADKEYALLEKAVDALYAEQGLSRPAFDPSYWLQRSQKNRGRIVPLESKSPLAEYDSNLYNDDDLYTHLAMQISRDNLTSGLTQSAGPIQTRRAGVEVSDRRRSKGRKLQHDPIPKLVNFKQIPQNVITPSPELLASLFKS